MNILVTGGAGFIGSHFIDAMFDDPRVKIKTLIVLDKLTYAGHTENLKGHFDKKYFRFIQGDINNEDILKEINSNLDWIINFAAESHVDRSITASRDFLNSNFVGVDTLLRSIINSKTKFLQISTDEVYGSIESGMADENHPLKPSSVYSSTKASADLLALSYMKTFKIPVVITRTCNNFGPRQNSEKLIPLAINAALMNAPIPIYGDGKNIREWIPVEMNARAIIDVMLKGEMGNIYNIGSNNLIDNISLAEKIISLTKSKSKIVFVADRKGHDVRYCINSLKYKNISTLSSKFDFDDELLKTIDSFTHHIN